MKKIITVLMIVAFAFMIISCQEITNVTAKPFVDFKNDKVEIGHKNQYHLSFEKLNDDWTFNGVFIYDDGSYEKVFEGMEEDFFRYTSLNHNEGRPDTNFNSKIQHIELLNTEQGKSIKISNEQSTLVLTVNENDHYIKRDFVLLNEVENQLSDFQLSFTLRTNSEYILRETGAIATMDPGVVQSDLPYAFPAIYSKVYSNDKVYNVSNVVDYRASNQIFGKVRKRKVLDNFEFGSASSQSVFEATELKFVDYWSFDAKDTKFYDLIGQTVDQYALINPMLTEELIYNENMRVNSFGDISEGLYLNLLDPRTGKDHLLGAFVPYGYMEDHGGWGESFALLDVLKGMLRYAMVLDDETKINEVIQMAEILTEPQANGRSWIEPYDGDNPQSNEYFLHHTMAGGAFGNNSAGEETGNTPGISGWKYYDMLANLADIAYISDSDSLKIGFLKLMPFMNTLKLEGYAQPVAWFYQTREPATGHENKGSAGNASIWAYVHLMASILSDDANERAYYKSEALASLVYANSQDYFEMTSMRNAVKPVVIGWNVRANILAYKLTEDETYLTQAKEVAKSLLSIYYLNTNPMTFFPTLGYGYADLRERWEAYLEMSQSLWLITELLEYIPDDRVFLDLLYSVEKTYPYAFPINGNPYGNYQRNPGYDSLDGYYIPFEFSTGVLVDNAGGEGGTQSAYRQVKEIYGSGEVFLNYLMFEANAHSVDTSVLVLSTNGAHNEIAQNQNTFVVYNASDIERLTPMTFNLKQEGNYRVTINDVEIGVFSNSRLKTGISFYLQARESVTVRVSLV